MHSTNVIMNMSTLIPMEFYMVDNTGYMVDKVDKHCFTVNQAYITIGPQ